MRVRYLGPHTAVVLADGTVCERGRHTDVTDDVAAAVLSRSDFRRAPDPPRSRRTDPEPDRDDADDAGEED